MSKEQPRCPSCGKLQDSAYQYCPDCVAAFRLKTTPPLAFSGVRCPDPTIGDSSTPEPCPACTDARANSRSGHCIACNSDLVAGVPAGTKHDQGKLRWSLVPWKAMHPVVRVLMAGSRKYSDDNWLVVPDAPRRYLDAALRHLTAYAGGEAEDPETGESHLAHCACCLLFLLHFETNPQPEDLK